MDNIDRIRIRSHLLDMQRHLEIALYDLTQAEGNGCAVFGARPPIAEALERVRVKLLDYEPNGPSV